MNKTTGIKQVISDIVSLLFKSDKKETIDKALQLLLDFFEVDWIYVAVLEPKQHNAHFLYEARSEWARTHKEEPSLLSYATIPWMINTLTSGKDLIIHDLDDLPIDAHSDRELFLKQEIQSTMAIPLTFNDKIEGFIGFDSIRQKHHWSLSEVEDLHIVANIFSIIIERQHKQLIVEAEKKRSEMELEKARESDRLKTAFISNMSHEIRTPLNAIVGFSSIIAETENRDERRYFQTLVDKNNDLLLKIISDIMDFSKIESGEFTFNYTDVNLKDICCELSTHFIKRSRSNVKLLFQVEKHPDLILYTDENRIKQVIYNLISNAYKFTSEGSIVLSYRIVNSKVRISVSDTGIGIAPEYHKQIFERFTKVDNFSQGTGLGLSICKTIVESLKGEIGLNSLQGKGSTFWFTLPINLSSYIPIHHIKLTQNRINPI